MKRDTLFFDLDGTLLPLNMNAFVAQYMEILKKLDIKTSIGKHLSGYRLKRAFQYMLSPDHPDLSNEDAFFDYIQTKCKISRSRLEPLFDLFYGEYFDDLEVHAAREPMVREIVDIVKHKGYRLVLATNPIFPRIATEKRMRWAGLDEKDFVYITTFDNSRYSKPHLGYYQDVLDNLKLSAEQCIMIGNNVFEDLCALSLGFDAFLLTDYLIGDIRKAPECAKGNYSDLKKWAEALPAV